MSAAVVPRVGVGRWCGTSTQQYIITYAKYVPPTERPQNFQLGTFLAKYILTGVERLLYGSLSAVQCLLWLLYGAVWVGKHRVIIIEHRRPSCPHLTVTDLELRLHNTVSNPHSRIESVLALQFS